MSQLDRMNPQQILQLCKQQGQLLVARTAVIDGLGLKLDHYERELARVGSMLILAVRQLGGRMEVSDEEQKAIGPMTTVNIEDPTDERPTWVLSVIEPLPTHKVEDGDAPTDEPTDLQVLPGGRQE